VLGAALLDLYWLFILSFERRRFLQTIIMEIVGRRLVFLYSIQRVKDGFFEKRSIRYGGKGIRWVQGSCVWAGAWTGARTGKLEAIYVGWHHPMLDALLGPHIVLEFAFQSAFGIACY
jgi:hypothetical protein